MKVFTDICCMIVPSLFVWVLFFTLVVDDSKLQKYRVRCSIENIYKWIMSETKDGSPPCAFNIIHKNKKFSIGIIKNEVNYHYCTYRIFINGDEAAVYHQLKHLWCSNYYFEEINKRHKDEVVSILHAGNKVLKKMNKPKKVKNNGWDEYSYFK